MPRSMPPSDCRAVKGIRAAIGRREDDWVIPLQPRPWWTALRGPASPQTLPGRSRSVLDYQQMQQCAGEHLKHPSAMHCELEVQ